MLLLVGLIGQPFRLNSAPPLEVVEALLRKLPASALSIDIIALALEPLLLGAKRLDLNQKRGGHLVVIDVGDPPHGNRSLALYLRDPLVQCSDITC